MLTCLGDGKTYSYLKSKSENSLSDKIALQVIKKKNKNKIYGWLNRGSDERQFNSPGVELDLGSLMRSKYETFKEYHTSEDSLGKFVNKKTLNQSFKLITQVIMKFEKSIIPISKVVCEPHLSKINLYPHVKLKNVGRKKSQEIIDFVSYSNGKNLLEDIAKKINISKQKPQKISATLKKHNLN